jgi:rhodanese-related sulfurtransferase
MVLGALSSCAVQKPLPEKEDPLNGSWGGVPEASRTMGGSGASLPSLVSSQNIEDLDRQSSGPELVGAHALQTWLESEHLKVLDLNPERIAMKYPHIPNSIRVGSGVIEDILQHFSGTVVLVAHSSQQDRLDATWKALKERGDLDTVILEGGIEAWAKLKESL